MLESGGDADLAAEPVGADGGAEVRVEELEGDGIARAVVGEEDGRHAAVAELRARWCSCRARAVWSCCDEIRFQSHRRSEDEWERYLGGELQRARTAGAGASRDRFEA